MASCLAGVHGLAGGDGDHLVDVVDGAAAAEVVDRAGDALEDGAYGLGLTDPLDDLLGDVADFQGREDEHVGLAGDGGAGGLLGAH